MIMDFTIDLRNFSENLELAIQALEDADNVVNRQHFMFAASATVDKLKEQRGKKPILEIKRTESLEWKTWSKDPPLIQVSYPDDSIRIDTYSIQLPFQEPIVSIGGSVIWYYRIDNSQSFREMRESLICPSAWSEKEKTNE